MLTFIVLSACNNDSSNNKTSDTSEISVSSKQTVSNVEVLQDYLETITPFSNGEVTRSINLFQGLVVNWVSSPSKENPMR
jgi:hypothetical protein